MWRMKVRESYSTLQQLQAYDETYGIAQRCGFKSAAALWEANPIIMGSTNPADFGLSPTPDINKILAMPRHKGCSARGADMGRRTIYPDDPHQGERFRLVNRESGSGDQTPPAPRLYLQRLRLSDGCYDSGGAYWGGPADIWAAFALQEGSAQEFDVFITCRASHREAAQAAIRATYPAAQFIKEYRQVAQAAKALNG